jgi:MSHA biogenesis protein MshP
MTRQSGFGAIAAIMVLVLLAAFAAAIIRIGATQQQTSAQDVLSSRAWQAAKAGIDWGMYQAMHGSFNVINSSGIAGQFTITSTNDFVLAGVTQGMAVAGTGVAAGAVVESVDSCNQITVTAANTGAVSGALSFGSAPAGIWFGSVPAATNWDACAPANQTLDLSAETGFWVTVECYVARYNEGSTCSGTPISLFKIRAVACNSSAGCPDNARAPTPGYIERRREVIIR